MLDRKLLFVTGKGGVGKTSVASAIGVLAAARGRKTLVCEVDAKGNLADFYGVGPLDFAGTEVRKNLHAMAMDTEESLKEYLSLQLRVPLLSRVGPLARTFDFVANAAPGVKEILTVGKLTYEVRERNYDLVVVDASATGHVVGELGSPVAIKELVSVGVVRSQTDWMIDILTDPAQTGVVVVTVPEEMPVSETLELLDRLEDETDIDVASVVVNRVLPELFGRGEEAIFERLNSESGRVALREAAGDGSGDVLDGAELAVGLRRSSVGHLTRLREGVPGNVPLVYLPFLFHRSHGVRATSRIAEALGEELG
ncbi:MAG: ArsA family ATPase [Actinomycetia bacterium]|nr:ArsA family ATPase [Actinomycetes bacterium]